MFVYYLRNCHLTTLHACLYYFHSNIVDLQELVFYIMFTNIS